MPLESATFVNQLDQTRPTATDVKSEGDDVMRLIKSTLKNSFPNVGGAVNATHTELNRLVGATEDVQPRLSATLSAPNGETLNRLPAAGSRQGGFLTFNASTGQPEVTFSIVPANTCLPLTGGTLSNTLNLSAGAVRIQTPLFSELYFGPANTAAISLDVAASALRTFVGGSERTRLDSSGNVNVLTGAVRIQTAAFSELYFGPANTAAISLDVSASALRTFVGGSERSRIDSSGNTITQVQTAAPTLTTNQQMVFALTSNTNLRISVRGTDGTTRVANITLA